MLYAVIGFAILLAGAVIAGAVVHLKRERLRERQEEFQTFRSVVVQQLQKRGPKAIQLAILAEENEVSPELAERVAATVYSASCEQAVADAVITETDKAYLNELRLALGLSPAVARRLEILASERKYVSAAENAMNDGVITPEEAMHLEQLRVRFGISKQHAAALVGDSARLGYQELFRNVIQDGRITKEELEQLRRFRETLGIGRDEANDIVNRQVLGLYRDWCSHVVQDGEVTADEERGFEWLRSEFNLNPRDTARYDEQIQSVKRLAAYRRGNLPKIRTNKMLQGGETCHIECQCRFEWRTSTKRKAAVGELVVTSHRVYFFSPAKNFSVSPSRIIDLVCYANALEIRCATNGGSGTYFVHDAESVEAILIGVMRQHKLPQLCASLSSERSRHIPDAVRRQVFIRDGGRCVQCGADSPLHYDHILPFSRGGANTVENIRVLCQRCNLRKSDSI
jgi:hypothetical protein